MKALYGFYSYEELEEQRLAEQKERLARRTTMTDRSPSPDSDKTSFKLTASLQLVVKYVWQHYYSHPYAGSSRIGNIARRYHGIQHAVRATIAMTAIANLREQHQESVLDIILTELRAYGVPIEITPANQQLVFRLIQTYCLFHDTARQNDGIDYWDRDSASLFYQYAVSEGINPGLAKAIAEFGANKDFDPKAKKPSTYWVAEQKAGSAKLHWSKLATLPSQKSLTSKLIHDGDCLDIIRARYPFDVTQMDIYRDIENGKLDTPAQKNIKLQQLALVIATHRGLIHSHGDTFGDQLSELKSQFENASCLTKTLALLSDLVLYRSMRCDDDSGIEIGETEIALTHRLNEGRLWFRGILEPHRYAIGCSEDQASGEIRRNFSLKGNPYRSGVIGGCGVPLYYPTGLCYLLNSPENVVLASMSDQDTGLGGSEDRETLNPKDYSNSIEFSELLALIRSGHGGDTHTEVMLRHIPKETPYIYYTTDPVTIEGNGFRGSFTVGHSFGAFNALSAFFIQDKVRVFTGKDLPIVRYDTPNSRMVVERFSSGRIVQLWANCIQYLIGRIDYYTFYKNYGKELTRTRFSLGKIIVKALHFLANWERLQPSAPYSDLTAFYPSDVKERIYTMMGERFSNLIKFQKLYKHPSQPMYHFALSERRTLCLAKQNTSDDSVLVYFVDEYEIKIKNATLILKIKEANKLKDILLRALLKCLFTKQGLGTELFLFLKSFGLTGSEIAFRIPIRRECSTVVTPEEAASATPLLDSIITTLPDDSFFLPDEGGASREADSVVETLSDDGFFLPEEG